MTRTAKNILIIIIAIIIVGSLVWWGSTRQKSPEVEKPIKIGVIASLTGTGATRGENAQQGLELALKEIEESGMLDDQKIKLLYQDAPLVAGGEVAITAFNQLVKVEKVVAVIGPMGSPTAVPVAAIVDEVKVPTIVHTASAKMITADNEYVFRLWPISKNYAESLILEIQKRGYKKIASLTSMSDNSIDLFDALSEEFKAQGDEISFVADERATTEDKDFRTQLTKIKESDADSLFINLHEGQIGIAAKQARELKINIPIFTNSVTSVVELEIGAEALEGAWYTRFAGYNEEAKQKFIDEYGKEPANPETAAAAHDALIVLAQAISEVGITPERIKDYIYTHSFSGSIGEISFMSSGDARVPLKIMVIKDGQIINLVE